MLWIVYGLLISTPSKSRMYFENRSKNMIVNRLPLFLAGHWDYGGKSWNIVKYTAVCLLFGGVFLGGLVMGIAPLIRNF